MKPLTKRILFGVGIVAIAIQFVRPASNRASVGPTSTDITNLYPTPPEVKAVLARACNDCHSDSTEYPWYAHVQPAGWWLANHISDGKRHLNFSQFGTYSPDRAAHKIEELIEEVEERKMPLRSYALLHRDARLSEAEITTLTGWARSIATRLPPP